MKNAPGCFAAASVFAHDSEVCRKCQVFDGCAAESLKTLEAIKSLVNVSDLLRRHDAAKRSARQHNTVVAEGSGEVPNAASPISKPVTRVTKVERVTYAVPVEHELILASLPVKPQDQARRMCAEGLIDKIKEGLLEGRNALSESKPRFLCLAVDRLLAGGFSKRDLRESFQNELGWGESTASSHVSITLPIFVGFGIAQEISGQFVVAPDLRA